MRALALAAVLVLTALPAAALEGRFASADGAVTVLVEEGADGELFIELALPERDEPLQLTLAPGEHGELLEEEALPLSWFEHLIGRERRRLPFDGARLAFVRRVDDGVVVTTLRVDAAGLPTLARFAVQAAGDGARLERRRYTSAGLERLPATALERVRP